MPESLENSDASAPCGCGSGIGFASCCALDRERPASLAAQKANLASVARALQGGDQKLAEQLLLDALSRAPADPAALSQLAYLRRGQGAVGAARVLFERVVRISPNDLAATQALALIFFEVGDLTEAERHARNAVRLAPVDPQSHNLMGMIMTEAQRPQVGEHHYRRVLALLDAPPPIVLANLAWNLKNQGRMDEARALYEQSAKLAPNVFQTLLGWARLEETDRNFERAGALLDQAERISPGQAGVRLTRAVVLGRSGAADQAVATLEDMQSRGGLGPAEWSEKGRLLDKLGRTDEAFAAFTEGKRLLRELTGQAYLAEDAQGHLRRLEGFFTAGRLGLLPRAATREDLAQPLFIVGFPRSGTTMVEQTLTAHPDISAGDELPTINELTQLIPRMLASPLAYPEALADLWMGDQAEGLENLRDYYLQRARQLGAMQPGARWFTDKMPLNETQLGLIGLLFPASPIVHLLRHPLDVVLSVFSNHLTHGYYCAYDLESIARHYVLVMDLVEAYRREMPQLRYRAVRYEDIIEDQEARVRELFDFIGAPFDARCLNFHENRRYARTASYAQVTEKLYDRSRYRYRAYIDHLKPVLPILEPLIERLGYRID